VERHHGNRRDDAPENGSQERVEAQEADEENREDESNLSMSSPVACRSRQPPPGVVVLLASLDGVRIPLGPATRPSSILRSCFGSRRQ
jgi:hypothetical protein